MSIFSRISNRIDRQGNLMAGMMEQLDIDLAKMNGTTLDHQLERAVRACAFCRHGDACQAWQNDHADGADRAPAFCPNAAFWSSGRNASH